MAAPRDIKTLTFHPDGALAAAFTVCIFVILFWRISGPLVPDWLGYADLWDHDGGWLLREGRDPLFVSILRGSRVALGPDGYPAFRAILFGGFILVAARLAYLMCVGRTSILIAVPIVAAAFLLKSLVQVREGLSFALIGWPLVAVLKDGRGGWLTSGVGAAIATTVHIGAAVLLSTWCIAFLLYVGPWRVLNSKMLALLILAVGIIIGSVFAFLITQTATSLEFSLRDLGVDTYAQFVGGPAKYAYWATYGVAVLMLRHQLIEAASGARRFGFAYLVTLGSMVLPAVYTVCAVLVFGQFYLPAVTSWAIRIFFTCMELGLVVTGLRGRANWITLGITIAMIADQSRLLGPTAI